MLSTASASAKPAPPPHYDGCPVFPPGNSAYNQDISKRPIDPLSVVYIASLSGFTTEWDNDTSEYLNTANATVPVLRVRQQVSYHSMPNEPWAPSYRIEDEPDGHSFVLDTASCHLYELYNTQYARDSNTLSAYSGGNWSLHRPYVAPRHGQPSAVASGISMFAGAVKWEELASGTISHALFLIAPGGSLSQWNYVAPASDTGQVPYLGRGSIQLPYGAKLRLRANYPTSGLGSQARTVVKALQTYGAIIGDTGGAWKFVYMNDLRYANAFDFRQLNALRIQPTDWEVVKLPQIQSLYHHSGEDRSSYRNQ